jgi:hypothetical protein
MWSYVQWHCVRIRCRGQAENVFAEEWNKRERIREHVPRSQITHTISARQVVWRIKMANKRKPCWPVPEGLEYADAAVFPRIPYPSIRNHGTLYACSRPVQERRTGSRKRPHFQGSSKSGTWSTWMCNRKSSFRGRYCPLTGPVGVPLAETNGTTPWFQAEAAGFIMQFCIGQ